MIRAIDFRGGQAAPWVTALAAGLAAVAVVLHLSLRYEAKAAEEQLRLLSTRPVPAAPTLPLQDFTQRLGPPVTSEELAAQMNELAEDGVTLSTFTATRREATARTLGRTEVQLTLHGTYPHLKSALGHLFERNPNAVLAHLTLHRATADVEAQITLWLLAPPLTH
jgi:hypothetical protein